MSTSATAESCDPTYKRRRPELTPCYKIIQTELNTFVRERELEERPLPKYVTEEFEAFLRCGLLQFGFIRLQCDECQEEKVVAFSCKKRGFCPSCCSKRKAEAAAHLTENVLPFIPYRQFVVTLPFPMRYWLHTNRKLRSYVHKVIIRHIHRLYTQKAEAEGIKKPVPGSISFAQRFSSSLALNLHWHILVADGVYFTNSHGEPRFREITCITDDDICGLLATIAKTTIKYLQKKGYLDQESQVVDNPSLDPLFADHPSIAHAAYSSILSRIAFGPNAGQKVRKIGKDFGFEEEAPLAKGNLCYSVNGFSIHTSYGCKNAAKRTFATAH